MICQVFSISVFVPAGSYLCACAELILTRLHQSTLSAFSAEPHSLRKASTLINFNQAFFPSSLFHFTHLHAFLFSAFIRWNSSPPCVRSWSIIAFLSPFPLHFSFQSRVTLSPLAATSLATPRRRNGASDDKCSPCIGNHDGHVNDIYSTRIDL